MDDVSKDVEFEDYKPIDGWPDNEYEKPPSIDCKFMGHVEDFPDELKQNFRPPLGDEFSVSQMKELSEEVKNIISINEMEDEEYREDINRVIEWLEYWSERDVSCRSG